MNSRPSLSHAPFVAVAGLSARMLAQSAARAGLRVAALDVFGDRDTREAAELWFDIGAGQLSIDYARLVAALERTARLPGLIGWIDGSGLEPFVAQLCRARGLPRFIGNPAEASAAVREPRRFFALLDALGIPHPPVAFTRPAEGANEGANDVANEAQGWLIKHADGCGGTHIEPATAVSDSHVPAQGYFQRRSSGRSLSALFIAARGSARVLGFAEQLTCRMGNLPFVHAGSIGPLGPVDLPPAVEARVRAAIAALCAQTGLAGINSCDFLLDGDTFELLEINTRPSSTMTLYETACPRPHRLKRRRPQRGAQVNRCCSRRVHSSSPKASATPVCVTNAAATCPCPARGSKPASRSARCSCARLRWTRCGTRSKNNARSFCNESKPAMSPTMPSSNATPEAPQLPLAGAAALSVNALGER
jgi:predicted ATP-grasp superfamily ATP-dependent carboligase